MENDRAPAWLPAGKMDESLGRWIREVGRAGPALRAILKELRTSLAQSRLVTGLASEPNGGIRAAVFAFEVIAVLSVLDRSFPALTTLAGWSLRRIPGFRGRRRRGRRFDRFD